MIEESHRSSRRDFVTHVGRVASAVALGTSVAPAGIGVADVPGSATAASLEDWDLSWIGRLGGATDRAVFDWPTLGNPGDPIVLEIAARYLDNCAAAYGTKPYEVRVVLNIRTQAVPAALNDDAWRRFALGEEYKVQDPATQQPAVRNPFMYRAPVAPGGFVLPTLDDLLKRGAIVLVCDFALGHLSTRLAAKTGRTADDVHRELRNSFVRASYAVPSGIFGLARAQNAGCAFVRM